MFSTSFPSSSIISYSRSVDSALPIVRIRTVSSDARSFDWAEDVDRYYENETRGRGRSDAKKPLRFLFPTAQEPNPHPCLQAIFRRSSAPAYVSTETYAAINVKPSASPSYSFSSLPSSSSSSSTVAPSVEEDEWEETPEKEEVEWIEHTSISTSNLEAKSNPANVKYISVDPNAEECDDPVQKIYSTVPWAVIGAGAGKEGVQALEQWGWKTLWQR
ncbi:hypothetical protein [Phaffia rhodozyma]|uniref:Uncharacterized protein n=1 Tax=Phaffia rhodozyma TaxID=264483 RepID=A0A0F7SU94_PHARH|nr:hypothetical protein [Phaffia rhodozyma]